MAQPLTRTAIHPARLQGMTPVEVAAKLRHLGGLVFFDTVGHSPDSSSMPISVIAARPTTLIEGNLHLPADRMRLQLELETHRQNTPDVGFPLGGLCGWVRYEGDFVFGVFPEMLVHVHETAEWWEIGELSEHLSTSQAGHVEVGPFEANITRARYIENVDKAQQWIAAGDIYQVNLSQSFGASVAGGSLFPLYEYLREASPAPMAAWLGLGNLEILSSSPELFLKISGNRIETRPIKGTRPRFADPDEDRRSAYELQTSAKEISELVMITDLLRNDLGQVCEFGSVAVAELLKLETLEQVHHLVSTVNGTLRDNAGPIDALAACFPGGSITGAPKKRAMEIIAELEKRQRGVYCGALGWLGFNGESQFNIAIRTLVREGDQLTYDVGGGIVADSDPQKEYEETLHKAAGMRLAIERWRQSSVRPA
jgi:para-aminobenzoate synthetase component 1